MNSNPEYFSTFSYIKQKIHFFKDYKSIKKNVSLFYTFLNLKKSASSKNVPPLNSHSVKDSLALTPFNYSHHANKLQTMSR